MRSLAKILLAAGWRLSGSDLGSCAGLPDAITICPDPLVGYLDPNLDLLIYSPAIDQQQVELQTARMTGIPTFSYPEILGQLMQDQLGIAIAGTHGKSTVVGMVASILVAAEADPLVICGAECSRFGRGPYMIAEACEYRSSFLHLKPRIAAILNIEPDHFDYYRSNDHLENEFLTFAEGMDEQGTLVASADCQATSRLAARLGRGCVTFGIDRPADWRATPLAVQRGTYHFRLEGHGQPVAEIRLRVPGRHNMLNAVAAAVMAVTAGASPDKITHGLEAFNGLQRRLQTLGSVGGITVIDDYAHHPTEISAALQAVRQQHPTARITCIFEPHQASRTQSLRVELAASLQKADTLAVMEIFRAREAAWQTGEITAEAFAAQLRSTGADVFGGNTAGAITDWIGHRVANGLIAQGDVVLTLGAGRIGDLAHGVYQRIREVCADR